MSKRTFVKSCMSCFNPLFANHLYAFSIAALNTACIFAEWQTVDSVSIIARVPAKSSACLTIDKTADSLAYTPSASTGSLSEKAKQAIAYAPRWLAPALEDRFAGLDTASRDEYARIILAAKDPCVDEIAFTIAHLPREVLSDKNFYPAIIAENAAGIYSADSVLGYVSIVDSGSATKGGDYFSTTAYQVLVNGTAENRVLPREMYYWFVVHPKLQGELPAYIRQNDPNPTTPQNGSFWRTFLWNHKETNYTALKDTMKGMTFLWALKVNSPEKNGALGKLTQWCNVIMPWGDHPQYRWPQPVYLYGQHCGTCSEHGWFASAAARTALIPATLTKAPRMDHKWNEFFDQRWIDWEPINGWIDRIDEASTHANDYWADKAKPALGGCFNWRGDGYIWGTTERYSKVCTLAVAVNDSKGKPIDGARIIVDMDGVPGNFLLAGWTGSDGLCRFLLGDAVPSFTAALSSKIGNASATTIISNSLPDKKYTWSPKITGTVPELKVQQAPLPAADTPGTCRIAYSIDARNEIVYGKHNYSLYDYSFPCTFSDERTTGNIGFFICDDENFALYRSDKEFKAAVVNNAAVTADSFFTLPAGTAKWNVVLSGEGKTVNTSIVKASFKLLRQGPAEAVIKSSAPNYGAASVRIHALNSVIIIDNYAPTGGPLALRLYSSLGRLAFSMNSDGGKKVNGPFVIDARHLPAGAYCAILTAGHMKFRSTLVIAR